MDEGFRKLEEIAQQIQDERKQGLEPSDRSQTTREFISWFGYHRRSQWFCDTVREKLESLGLYTEPDFQNAYIDGPTTIRDSFESNPPTDSTLRVVTLNAAHNTPATVTPNDSLTTAISHMMGKDFSQLPVMSSPKTVKGIITWESIGTARALGQTGDEVRHYMDTAEVIDGQRPLFEAVDIIARVGYVLVKAQDNTITGIVTASDLNDLFLQLAEPFLLVGEIESHVRRIIHGKFTTADLASVMPASDPKRTYSIADLTFGDYCRLLQNPILWGKLNIPLDRAVLVGLLEDVTRIRNNVMHFNPDGVDPKDIQKLRDASPFFLRIAHLNVTATTTPKEQ